MSDDEIVKKKHLGMLEFVLKNIHYRDTIKLWDKFLTKFKTDIVVDKEREYIYLRAFLQYTDCKLSEERQGDLEQIITKHLSEAEKDTLMRTIVNAQDHNSSIALHFASIFGRTKIVKLLCKHKADINIQDDCGLTPLDAALIHGHTKIVKYLHKHQDNISVQDNFNVTTLTTTLECDSTNSDTLDHNIFDDINIYGDQTPLAGVKLEVPTLRIR